MRLTKAIKNELNEKLCLILERKRTKVLTTLPSIGDAKQKQEYLLADKFWKEKYGKYPFKSVPDELLNKEMYLRVGVKKGEDEAIQINLLHFDKARPCQWSLVIMIEEAEWEKMAANYLTAKTYESKVNDEVAELRVKINRVLAGITTSKQLEKEWPEAFELLPAQDKGTGLICVTDIKDINRKVDLL